MAKFYGTIGFATTTEIPENSGIWVEAITERKYSGDLNRLYSRSENSGYVNDDIGINHEISILADPFAYNNYFSMRYVECMGAKWKVTGVEVQYPRLILTVGGLYNGQTET